MRRIVMKLFKIKMLKLYMGLFAFEMFFCAQNLYKFGVSQNIVKATEVGHGDISSATEDHKCYANNGLRVDFVFPWTDKKGSFEVDSFFEREFFDFRKCDGILQWRPKLDFTCYSDERLLVWDGDVEKLIKDFLEQYKGFLTVKPTNLDDIKTDNEVFNYTDSMFRSKDNLSFVLDFYECLYGLHCFVSRVKGMTKCFAAKDRFTEQFKVLRKSKEYIQNDPSRKDMEILMCVCRDIKNWRRYLDEAAILVTKLEEHENKFKNKKKRVKKKVYKYYNAIPMLLRWFKQWASTVMLIEKIVDVKFEDLPAKLEERERLMREQYRSEQNAEFMKKKGDNERFKIKHSYAVFFHDKDKNNNECDEGSDNVYDVEFFWDRNCGCEETFYRNQDIDCETDVSFKKDKIKESKNELKDFRSSDFFNAKVFDEKINEDIFRKETGILRKEFTGCSRLVSYNEILCVYEELKEELGWLFKLSKDEIEKRIKYNAGLQFAYGFLNSLGAVLSLEEDQNSSIWFFVKYYNSMNEILKMPVKDIIGDEEKIEKIGNFYKSVCSFVCSLLDIYSNCSRIADINYNFFPKKFVSTLYKEKFEKLVNYINEWIGFFSVVKFSVADRFNSVLNPEWFEDFYGKNLIKDKTNVVVTLDKGSKLEYNMRCVANLDILGKKYKKDGCGLLDCGLIVEVERLKNESFELQYKKALDIIDCTLKANKTEKNKFLKTYISEHVDIVEIFRGLGGVLLEIGESVDNVIAQEDESKIKYDDVYCLVRCIEEQISSLQALRKDFTAYMYTRNCCGSKAECGLISNYKDCSDEMSAATRIEDILKNSIMRLAVAHAGIENRFRDLELNQYCLREEYKPNVSLTLEKDSEEKETICCFANFDILGKKYEDCECGFLRNAFIRDVGVVDNKHKPFKIQYKKVLDIIDCTVKAKGTEKNKILKTYISEHVNSVETLKGLGEVLLGIGKRVDNVIAQEDESKIKDKDVVDLVNNIRNQIDILKNLRQNFLYYCYVKDVCIDNNETGLISNYEDCNTEVQAIVQIKEFLENSLLRLSAVCKGIEDRFIVLN